MKKVAIILADGFEELEAISVIDILKRASISVEILALGNVRVTGAHDITIEADEIFNYYNALDLDGIVFAGGMSNARTLSEEGTIIDLVNHYYEENKMVAAICASPAFILPRTKIDRSIECTCYPDISLTSMLDAFRYVDDNVVVSKNVITSQSPFTALEFALSIVDYLGGDARQLLADLEGR